MTEEAGGRSDRPWLRHYDEGVPHSLAPYPDETLLDVLRAIVEERPDHPAVLFKGRALTASRLDRLSDAFAVALLAMDVRPGDRVAAILPNCPQFLVAELGAWKAGAVFVPLNPLYTGDELARPLADTGATIAVVLTPFYRNLKDVQAHTAVRRVVATNIKEHLPWRLRLLFTWLKEKQNGHRIVLEPEDLWLAELVSRRIEAPPEERRPRPDDPALILLSGGTTGTPKGVVGRHRDLVITGLQLHAWYAEACRPWVDALLLPLPLFHAFGSVAAQGVAFMGRQRLALVPNPRDLGDLIATIRKVRPAIFAGVPTLFAALLNHPDVRKGRVDFRSMKLCASGAAPLMADTKDRFEALTQGRIIEGYSMTEAMIACVATPLHGKQKAGSVGIPVPDVEVKIVDSETGDRELPSGELGEILLRAPQMMRGYWRNPEESALALRHHGAGGPWLHTGDLGTLDEDGFVSVVDRMKDLIKIGGLQVWPREVEEAVASHPAVAEVGVAGVPHAGKGERAKAWVVLRPGMTATAEEIRAHCRARLAPFKVPSEVEFRTALPKTMVGKILRRALVAEHVAG